MNTEAKVREALRQFEATEATLGEAHEAVRVAEQAVASAQKRVRDQAVETAKVLHAVYGDKRAIPSAPIIFGARNYWIGNDDLSWSSFDGVILPQSGPADKA